MDRIENARIMGTHRQIDTQSAYCLATIEGTLISFISIKTLKGDTKTYGQHGHLITP
jgi:hypothetical protein